MLVRNLVKEGLEPNYQTYAGLLEVCGNINDVRKTEYVLTEMEQKVIITYYMRSMKSIFVYSY